MVNHLFAGIPVIDRDQATTWYERFAGRPADLIPNEDEAAWQLSESGWIYVVTDPSRAGSGLHALLVDDLDSFLAGLKERGIAIGPVETIGDAVRFTIVTDPDGNRLKVGQTAA
ncbi:MAG TPA: VOC family protein [Solirubrobacterales bacterium]|nr:VOC family protein [Solirubrobacterales bacterium]